MVIIHEDGIRQSERRRADLSTWCLSIYCWTKWDINDKHPYEDEHGEAHINVGMVHKEINASRYLMPSLHSSACGNRVIHSSEEIDQMQLCRDPFISLTAAGNDRWGIIGLF